MTNPSFEEFLSGKPIITTTLDIEKSKLTVELKNDRDSGLQYVEFYVNRHNKKQYHVFNLEEIRQYYNLAIMEI